MLESHGYLGLSMFTGATMVFGSLLVAAARFGYNREVFVAV